MSPGFGIEKERSTLIQEMEEPTNEDATETVEDVLNKEYEQTIAS